LNSGLCEVKSRRLDLFRLLLSSCVDVMLLTCRPVVVPQDDLGALTSPSLLRSADPTVVGEVLADDARTTNPP
jgi:hypothetical protein